MWLPAVLVFIIFIGIGGLALIQLAGGLLFDATVLRGTSGALPPGEAVRIVNGSLRQGGVAVSLPLPGQNCVVAHTYTQSDGFHGDGTDWCEFVVPPMVADGLRAALGRSPAVLKTGQVPTIGGPTPDWWPKQWYADVEVYSKDLQYFILPASGNHLWYMRVRT